MKKGKILKGAVVLLITVVMVLSTFGVTADTLEEHFSATNGKMSSNYIRHPQIQDTIIRYDSRDCSDLFVQIPLGPDDDDANCYTSDVPMGWKVYDDFWEITEPICDIHWWGFTMFWTGSGWDHGNPMDMKFDITFYLDSAGQPGSVVCSYVDVDYSVSGTGIMYQWMGGNWHELLYFEALLEPCCDLANGWVSIESTFSPDNYAFLWMNSVDGNLLCYQNDNTHNFDVAFKLTGEVCEPCIDVENYIWDPELEEWKDADTENEAVDLPICEKGKKKITVHNCGDCTLFDITVKDMMHDSLEYISAVPEPDHVEYDPPYYYLEWGFGIALHPCEIIEIIITFHVVGEECSVDVNHVDVFAHCEHCNTVSDEDDAYVHCYKPSRSINRPFLEFLESRPNLLCIMEELLQRLGLQ